MGTSDRSTGVGDAPSPLTAARVGAFQVPGVPGLLPRVDAAALALFGMTDTTADPVPDSMAPTTEDFLRSVHEEDRDRVRRAVDDSFADGTGHYIEYRVVRPSGEVAWLASRAELVRVDDVPWLHGALLDITERREAQDEARLRSQMLDALDVAVVATDMTGRIIYWNRFAEALYGWRADEVHGRLVQEVTPARHTAEQANDIMTALAAGKSWHGYFGVQRRDGKAFVAHVTNSPIEVGGRQVGIVGVSTDATTRLAMEEEVRRSEQLFRSTFDNAAVGVALVDLDGHLTVVNDRFCRITGYDRDRLLGRHFREITHPDDIAADDEGVRALLDGATDSFAVDKRYVRPDRSVVWVRLTASLVRDEEEGAPLRLLGVVEDITDRVGAEAAVRRGERFTRSVLDSLFGFVGVLTPDGTVVDANRAPLEIAALTADDVVGRRFWDCYWWNWSADVQGRMRDAVARAAAGEVVRYDTPVRTAGDGRIWIDFQIHPLIDDDGRVTHLIPSGTDISGRRQVEDALRESEQRFRLLADTLPVLVWVHGPDGRQEWVNDTYLRYFAVTREEMRDEGWRVLVHPDDEAAYGEEFGRCVADRSDFHAEVRVRNGEGEWRWVESRARPRFDEHGAYLGHLGVSADITDRKTVEQALRQREAAERRERAKAEFLADVLGLMETAETLPNRAQMLADGLVPRFADAVTVESPHRSVPLLGVAHRDRDLVLVLRSLRARHRLEAADDDPARRVAAGDVVWESRPVPGDGYGEREDLLARLAPHSHVAVPLSLGGDEAGALILGRSDPDAPPYTSDDVMLVQEIADRAGVLLARARVRDEEHEIAVRLQSALLPDRVVSVPGVTVAALYESAGAVLEVGGDWYDSYEVPGGRIGLAVGDVVGHGLESAAAMGRMRAALAALAPHRDDPGTLLADLDGFALGPDGVAFATAAYAVLDPVTGRLAHASAGHPHALVVDPDGTTRFLEGGRSWPLGVGRTPRATAEVTLRPGSLLVMYSDGLVERSGESISEGMARLQEAGRHLAGAEPAAACSHLVDVLIGDRPRRDDLVVLAARLSGPG